MNSLTVAALVVVAAVLLWAGLTFNSLGANGIAVGGSTGEGHTLTAEESRDLVAAALRLKRPIVF